MKSKQVVQKDALDRLAFDGISSASALSEQIASDSDAVEDTFAAFYKSQVATEGGDSLRKQLLDQMLALPEYQHLHQATQLDDIASALASAEFSQTLIEQIQKVEEQRQDGDDGDGQPGDGDGQGSGQSLEEILGEKGMGALRATLRRSLEQAEQKTEDWADAAAGWGIDPGSLSDLSGPDRIALVEELMGSPKLKNISALIGRFKNVVNAASTMVYSHGQDELVDITTGRDLHLLLPTEMVKLQSNPLLFYADYVEGRLLQYNLRGEEPQGKGPIIVALDVSGSMSGWREQYARALTMALVSIAVKEKRAFSVIFFDSQVHDVKVWQKGSAVTLTERLAIVNRRSDGGGTDFVPPLKAAIEIRQQVNAELKPADLVFITDGDCRLPEEFEAEFSAIKKASDLRVYGFAVGSPRTLTFCDSVYQIANEGQIEEVKDMVRKTMTRK